MIYTDQGRSHSPISVLIAGIGGGSLGLEIYKSLRLAGGYCLIGTDISDKAFGSYEEGFDRTYLLGRTDPLEYAAQLLEVCEKEDVDAIAPGAEQTHKILAEHQELFENAGILLMINASQVIELCSDKTRCLDFLRQHGIPVPAVMHVENEADVTEFGRFPCVVKPARDSGGSNMVFLAEDEDEAKFFVRYIRRRGPAPLLQEYIDSLKEFTVGVLSNPADQMIGSIALCRSHDQKLSVSLRYQDRVISSGWSQGLIDDFPEVRSQAERIASVLGSRWALNIQGRLAADGTFYPFEINPRHSGTTYLRALAGFNEPHILLQECLRGRRASIEPPKTGFYLRAFTEKYVPLRKGSSDD